MKSNRLLICAVLLLGLIAAGTAPAASAKKSTYAIVGYYDGATPPPALVDKAAAEIGKMMKNYTAVKDPQSADRIVDVTFTRTSYQVNYNGSKSRAMQRQIDTVVDQARMQAMVDSVASLEKAGGHGR